MKLEFGSKSLEYDTSNQPYRTKVTLVNADGAIMPVFLSAEKVDLSPTELLAEALEVVYQDNFPRRAEDERFNLIGQKIAELDNALERANKQYDRVEELVKATTGTVNELIMSLMPDDEEEAKEDEPETETY